MAKKASGKGSSKGKGKKQTQVEAEDTRESRDRIAGLYGHGAGLAEHSIPAAPVPVELDRDEKSVAAGDNSLDADLLTTVESETNQSGQDQHSQRDSQQTSEGKGRQMNATLKFTKLSKSGKFAIYEGLRTTIRVATTNFPDQKPEPSFEVSGNFAGPREKKAPLTKEERAAARKAKPKLTLAERIEKQRKQLQKLEEKASKEAPTPEPATV